MNTAKVIIGAAYGDEGKGLATDYHAANAGDAGLVVRFNGGAQAGHTVQAPDGRRHVFSHFGAGTFAGVDTHLSRFFVCHPMLFHSERRVLEAEGLHSRVSVDPRCPVTTPYDVMLNQLLEASRGSARHGSCGIGFGETLERQESSPFSFRVRDLLDPRRAAFRLVQIRDEYVPRRLQALGLESLPEDLRSDAIIERFMDDAEGFLHATDLGTLAQVGNNRCIIFEGAQGLLLDMDRGCFPYVTRSNTGLKNVVALSKEAGICRLDVTYACRAYVTRHGAGPLRHELPGKPYVAIDDRTNIGNPWQGQLRFGRLDVDLLARTIRADLEEGEDLVAGTELLLTCLDQTQGILRFVRGGRCQRSDRGVVARAALAATGLDNLLVSYGPTRDDVALIESARRCA